METVVSPVSQGQEIELHHGKTPAFAPLDFSNPEAVQAWIAEMTLHVRVAVDAGYDAVRNWNNRRTSNTRIRRTLSSSKWRLLSMLEAAERGLEKSRVA